MNWVLRSEQDTQIPTKELWFRQRSSDEEEDDDETEAMTEDKLGEILFARLACISNLCPDAGYSNRGLQSKIQLDTLLDRYDIDNEESNVPSVQDASVFEKARNKVRKAVRTEWTKSTKLGKARSHIKRSP